MLDPVIKDERKLGSKCKISVKGAKLKIQGGQNAKA